MQAQKLEETNLIPVFTDHTCSTLKSDHASPFDLLEPARGSSLILYIPINGTKAVRQVKERRETKRGV
ncbi:hypothetical protein KM043_003394 [Ampulex compressa]|nr:hypothetical protein KM043_003394 [Ampulex compressa]